MKIIIPFLATIFLAAMTFAQEESASPAESTAPATEEKASATVEETPAANEKLAVHSYGPNMAVVVGTEREKGTGKDGKAFDRSFRFTDTWMLRNGQWQCVASQVMKLKG